MLSLNFTCLDSTSDDSWLGIVKECFRAPPMNSGVFEKTHQGLFWVCVCERVRKCMQACVHACGEVRGQSHLECHPPFLIIFFGCFEAGTLTGLEFTKYARLPGWRVPGAHSPCLHLPTAGIPSTQHRNMIFT